MPEDSESVTYTTRVGTDCRTSNDRSLFLETHRGDVVVISSTGDQYDIVDTNPLKLLGSWNASSRECVQGEGDS